MTLQILFFVQSSYSFNFLNQWLLVKDDMIAKFNLSYTPFHRLGCLWKFLLEQVILATNIAESSVTIPKVAFVIDSCRSLQVFWDSNRKMESAELSWVSRSQVVCQLDWFLSFSVHGNNLKPYAVGWAAKGSNRSNLWRSYLSIGRRTVLQSATGIWATSNNKIVIETTSSSNLLCWI